MIHHLAFESDWQAAQAAGEYRVSTRGASIDDVGFLHACSDEAQLAGVAARFYGDVDEPLVVLDLDEDALADHGLAVRLEPGMPDVEWSPLFPHVYGGSLPVTAVRRVRPHAAAQAGVAEEWWDVLDADGRSTGRRFRRGAQGWEDGTYHLVVGVCAFRPDGTVLVSQRASTKDWPLAWEFPAGSALAGETSPQAAARELGEEVGIVVTPGDLRCDARLTEATAFFDLHSVAVPADTTITVDPTEVATARWVDVAEVERMAATGEFAAPWLPRLTAWLPRLRTLTA